MARDIRGCHTGVGGGQGCWQHGTVASTALMAAVLGRCFWSRGPCAGWQESQTSSGSQWEHFTLK